MDHLDFQVTSTNLHIDLNPPNNRYIRYIRCTFLFHMYQMCSSTSDVPYEIINIRFTICVHQHKMYLMRSSALDVPNVLFNNKCTSFTLFASNVPLHQLFLDHVFFWTRCPNGTDAPSGKAKR